MGDLTRRRFVQNSLLTGGALASSRGVMAASELIPARPTRLTPVGYEQVRLLDGPLREQLIATMHSFSR
jgi:hypothetical protein